jgi:phosphoglycolate phosphatase
LSRSDQVAIVFDLDNTLVHSRIDFPAMRRRIIEVIGAAQLPLPAESELASLAVAEIIHLAVQPNAPTDVVSAIWKTVTDEETKGMELASIEDDAIETLLALKAEGVALALLTNNARAAALAALDRFDLLDPFDLILARDDVAALKPSPAGLQLAAGRLAPLGPIAMVGDATIDGMAANRAGIPFIAFRPREADMDRRGIRRWATIQSLAEVRLLLRPLRESRISRRPCGDC